MGKWRTVTLNATSAGMTAGEKLDRFKIEAMTEVALRLAGVLMIAGVLPWLSGPIALFIGTVGAVSVFKAVYIDKRALKCACVGGGSNVPLGFVSLTENLMMMGMGLWTLLRLI